jgi:transposase
LRIDGVTAAGRSVRIAASTVAGEGSCPGCGAVSTRVHSGYQRTLGDAAVGGRELLIVLRVRRFFCGNSECVKTTFAEQVPGLSVRH